MRLLTLGSFLMMLFITLKHLIDRFRLCFTNVQMLTALNV